jgi:hypothetical protein
MPSLSKSGEELEGNGFTATSARRGEVLVVTRIAQRLALLFKILAGSDHF